MKIGNVLQIVWFFTKTILGIAPLIFLIIFDFWYLLIFYFLIGLFLFVILNRKDPVDSVWISNLIVSIIFWPVLLFLWSDLVKPKKKTFSNIFDEIVENNPELKIQKEYFASMNKDGTTKDIILNAYGKYGLEATNPIPTNSIFGSNAYLGKLRDKTGNPINYERIGSTKVSNIKNLIDSYVLSDLNGNVLATIYISPYQKNISKKSPEGFILK